MKTSPKLGFITVNVYNFIAKVVENGAECNDLGDLGKIKLNLDTKKCETHDSCLQEHSALNETQCESKN